MSRHPGGKQGARSSHLPQGAALSHPIPGHRPRGAPCRSSQLRLPLGSLALAWKEPQGCHNQEVPVSPRPEILKTFALGAEPQPPASRAPTQWSRAAPTHAEPGDMAAPRPGPASDWRRRAEKGHSPRLLAPGKESRTVRKSSGGGKERRPGAGNPPCSSGKRTERASTSPRVWRLPVSLRFFPSDQGTQASSAVRERQAVRMLRGKSRRTRGKWMQKRGDYEPLQVSLAEYLLERC